MTGLPARTTKHNLLFAAGLLAVAIVVASIALFAAPRVSARAAECNANSVMYCGFGTPAELIETIKKGDGLGHKDFAAIYDSFGLPSRDYDRFIAQARPATFYKDGRIVVDGKTIATDTVSFGRWESWHTGPGMVTKTIGTTTLYGNTPSRVFGSYSTMPGYVLFDATGTPQFMVIGPCGNPVAANYVRSNAACKLLNAKPVAGKLNTYDFSASGEASGLASITKYVYDFGDGSAKVTKTSASSVVRHEYTKGGSYKATVTVYATAPGKTQIVSSPASCQKAITVAIPYYQCVQLSGAIVDQKTYTYTFTAQVRYGNGATFVGADFDFGDGKTATGVSSVDGKTVSTKHSYAKAGNYSVSAVLRFSVNGKTVTAPTCRAAVTPTAPPVPECKPGIPVGDVRCNPCPYDASIPADDALCEAPVTTLPNTGAGNVVAISAAALVGGFLWYRHMLFRRHRAAYRAADLGTSPLPLAEPLDSTTPLAGTPVTPNAVHIPRPKSSLRRRRPF